LQTGSQRKDPNRTQPQLFRVEQPMVAGLDKHQSQRPAVSSQQSLLTGCASGTATAFITQPFDVLRTVMQTGANRPSSMSEATRMVVRQNGVEGLWRGVVPTIYRVGGGTAVYFCCLNHLKFSPEVRPSESASSQNSGARAFVSGFVARAAAASLMMPFTVVKTRFEAGEQTQGVLQTIRKIAMTERGGLVRGSLPTILRDAPFSGVYLFGLTKLMALSHMVFLKEYLPSSVLTFGAGLVAGALATIVTNPPDVIRTRMQVGDGPTGPTGPRRGMTAVMKEVVRSEGLAALFTLGLMPRIVKKSFQAAMTWALYQHITDMLALSAQAAARLGPEQLASSK
jgi:solute carrier family 25 protein 38